MPHAGSTYAEAFGRRPAAHAGGIAAAAGAPPCGCAGSIERFHATKPSTSSPTTSAAPIQRIIFCSPRVDDLERCASLAASVCRREPGEAYSSIAISNCATVSVAPRARSAAAAGSLSGTFR